MTTEAAPSIRASDADRERVAAIVSAAAGKGMLTLAEADERLAQVYAARYISDLAPITADLPDGGRSLAPADRPGRSTARSAARSAVRSAAWSATRGYLAAYLGWSAVLIAIWAATGAGYFWPAWPMIFFGIGALKHARWAHFAGAPAAEPTAGSPVAGGPIADGPGSPAGRSHRHGGYRRSGHWHGGYRHGGCGRR
ncbi:MAG TPA: DUF1707 domain-containing protein [Mycobacteriales bacterium]|nr:DUF1707 domain-containing protein [Mycobacteriales bacterium]